MKLFQSECIMNRQQLTEKIKQKKSFLCIGLDPDIQKIPPHLIDEPDPLFEFNSAIIDATQEYCIAYKLNFAFYEVYGSQGIQSLEKTIRYIKINYPDKFIIADAKRGDIGNTSEKYAQAVFEKLECDAITLSPYMGKDSIMPFLKYADKWAIVLGITSNEGAKDFQMIKCDNHKPLYLNIIEKTKEWGNKNNLMFVIGATHSKNILQEIRQTIPDYFILIPGIGPQGGDLETILNTMITNEIDVIINISRDIIYAGKDKKFDIDARIQAQYYQQKMQQILLAKHLI